ncbi:MAG: hypothetical protein Q8J92_00820 [Parvibaculum sp.]|nr:hypothetical protein [Parvibaculum sp.]
MANEPNASLSERLANYLAQLPPPAVVKLASGLEREKLRGTAGLPYETILSGLRPLLAAFRGVRPGMADPVRRFCQPFEDLLSDEDSIDRQRGRIARRVIEPMWTWLETELLPDALPDLAGRIIDHTLKNDRIALDAAVSVLHASAAAAIEAALDEARRDATRRREIEAQLGGETGIEDARAIAAVLSIAPAMLKLQSILPKAVADFDEGQVNLVKELYDDARERSAEVALYVPFVAMARLAESWQILRLARKVAHYRNDMLISRSELSVLGDLLLADMDRIARSAEGKRPGQADLDKLLEDVRRFARMSKGFTAEIDLRRHGEWGQRLLGARARLSAALSQEMARFETDLPRALPLHQIGQYGRGGPLRPDLSKAPDPARAARMGTCLRFIRGLAPICDAVGAQSHCNSIRGQITTYLNVYEDRLLDEMRAASGSARMNAEAFIEIAAGFREALGEDRLADVLRRRAGVALQAAS